MALFDYAYVRLAPQEQIGLHEQSTWELSYVVTGSGFRQIGEQIVPFESGEMMLVPPYTPHCWRFDETQTNDKGQIANICVVFNLDLLKTVALSFPILNERMNKLINDTCTRIFSRKQTISIAQVMKKMEKETDEERTASILRLLTLISDEQGVHQRVAHKRRDSQQSRRNQVINYIKCNAQRNIQLEHVAKHVGMSRSALCLFMKRNLGMTFSEYLNNIRIEHACELLKRNDISVKEVAYEVGYNSHSYFIRIFTKAKGCSPKEFQSAQYPSNQ